MKDYKTIQEAHSIGNDSWWLVNFEQLPTKASKKAQIKALKKDQDWQRSHIESVLHKIDNLIKTLEI